MLFCSRDMLHTFEDKAVTPDQIWAYSDDISGQRIPLIIDNGVIFIIHF